MGATAIGREERLSRWARATAIVHEERLSRWARATAIVHEERLSRWARATAASAMVMLVRSRSIQFMEHHLRE
jgi:hypothetical protein